MVVVVMGVCGSGKSTLGKILAERLKVDFLEGDDFHSPANLENVEGEPLTESDRAPGCRKFRILDRYLNDDRGVVSLVRPLPAKQADSGCGEDGCPPDSPARSSIGFGKRMARRKDHFMPGSLLQSQLETLKLRERGGSSNRRFGFHRIRHPVRSSRLGEPLICRLGEKRLLAVCATREHLPTLPCGKPLPVHPSTDSVQGGEVKGGSRASCPTHHFGSSTDIVLHPGRHPQMKGFLSIHPHDETRLPVNPPLLRSNFPRVDWGRAFAPNIRFPPKRD